MRQNQGFSILIALGTIGVLLIIVVGLASVYIRELKLSRTSYNDIIASAGAEGIFEYGMLKVRNHREGFADAVNSSDLDGAMLHLSSPRSEGMKSSYTIVANSLNSTFSLESNEHLIIPLFISDESLIRPAGTSKKPLYNAGTAKTQNLEIHGLGDLSWTIVAMKGSTNIGLSGSGDIIAGKEGVVRHRDSQCYDANGEKLTDCNNSSLVAEEIPYFWDESIKVVDFLSDTNIVDPYLMIYNNSLVADTDIQIKGSTPFSLPEMIIESTAQKADSSQIFRFTEDKSRYYDAIKFGVYNNQ